MVSMAHIHLLINHVPILGSIFVLTLFLIALVFKNGFLQKLSLWFLACVALATAVAYVSGDGTKRAVRGLPQVSDAAISLHEQTARYGLVLMFLVGVVSLGGIILYRKRSILPTYLCITVLVLLLASVVVMVYIGFLGGQIMHPEIRSVITLPSGVFNGKEQAMGVYNVALASVMPPSSVLRNSNGVYNQFQEIGKEAG
jgi:uncharacterized membrane protein